MAVSVRLRLMDAAGERRELGGALDAALRRVWRGGRFILGEEVERFEAAFARLCGVRHAVAVNSGTDALVLALRAVGLRPGDEVIVPALTFVATGLAVLHAGGVPRFADVDPDTLTLAPDSVRRALTRRTRAILPVHLYGHPANMDPLLDLARRKGLPVVEDACQAHGALYRGRPVGGLGAAAAFSFYPTKNLGAYGDGGMVVTRDAALAGRVRALREYGRARDGRYRWAGVNSRLDELQAAILRVKLRRLGAWNAARRRVAARYAAALAGVPGLRLPVERSWARSVHHLYVIRTARREAVRRALRAAGVEAKPHYDRPLHREPVFRAYARAACPIAERAAREVLSLPCHPFLAPADVRRIARIVRAHA